MPSEISLTGWRLLRASVDLACGVASIFGAFWIRMLMPLPFTMGLLPSDRLAFLALAAPLALLLQNPLLYFLGFYELPHPRGNEDRIRRLTVAVGLQALLMVLFFFLASQTFPRTVLLLFMVLNGLLLLLSRQILDQLVTTPKRRVAVIGCGDSAVRLAADIARYPWYGLEVIGHIPAPGEEHLVGPGTRLGQLDQVAQLLSDFHIDEIVIAPSRASWQTELIDSLSQSNGSQKGVLVLPNAFESLLGASRFRSVHDIPLIEVAVEKDWGGHEVLKRSLDVAASLVLLTLTSPVLLISCLLIRATSEGPVFYLQERVGRNRQPFVLWKLRTMHSNAEDGTEQMATRDDPRKTSVGSWLRALRIDEIPQLFNVLEGTMSLVGPRPERPGFVAKYSEAVPGYATRFMVRPGVTGLAQVNGEYESSADNKLRYDLAYISNSSLWLDLTILVRTVRIVLTSRGV